MTTPRVNGLHHVTAIASSAQANHDFWTRVLGLRFVKKTVNFDDPGTYHLYYGDERGAPGTAMTYFPWEHLPGGRRGSGEASLVQLSVAPGALAFWATRLEARGAGPGAAETVFGERRIVFGDPDGLPLALVEREGDPRSGWTGEDMPSEHAIRGFAGVTLTLSDPVQTADVLTGMLDYKETAREGPCTRYVARGGSPAGVIDIIAAPQARRAEQGAGSVHHVAFAVPDEETQEALRRGLLGAGLRVTPVIDRTYFRSIYFRSPGGVLFEVATAGPGFTIDEPVDSLGTTLRLPPQHEHLRAEIEAQLPPLAS